MAVARCPQVLLKEVARSFALSLRLLPRAMRPAAEVGYLLARLSDTVADVGRVEWERRVEGLRGLAEALFHGGACPDFSGWEREGLREGESRLLDWAPEVVVGLEGLGEGERELVLEVLGEILQGQRWDLEFFGGDEVGPGVEKGSRAVRVAGREEVERYAQWVAGSVGIFWTRLAWLSGVEAWPGEGAAARQLGRAAAYGRALQWVNILRDVPEDLGRGRCYLPGGNWGREALQRARDAELGRVREGLGQAEAYAGGVRSRRLRVSSLLPARLALPTLELLEGASWEDWERGVKIPRSRVRRELGRALWEVMGG